MPEPLDIVTALEKADEIVRKTINWPSNSVEGMSVRKAAVVSLAGDLLVADEVRRLAEAIQEKQ